MHWVFQEMKLGFMSVLGRANMLDQPVISLVPQVFRGPQLRKYS